MTVSMYASKCDEKEATDIPNEPPPERDEVALGVSDIQCLLTSIAAGTDEWSRGPDIPEEVITL